MIRAKFRCYSITDLGEQEQIVLDLARDLSRRQRQVFEDDIARRLGWSVKTVYSMKFKLIERLKRAA